MEISIFSVLLSISVLNFDLMSIYLSIDWSIELSIWHYTTQDLHEEIPKVDHWSKDTNNYPWHVTSYGRWTEYSNSSGKISYGIKPLKILEAGSRGISRNYWIGKARPHLNKSGRRSLISVCIVWGLISTTNNCCLLPLVGDVLLKTCYHFHHSIQKSSVSFPFFNSWYTSGV